MARKSVVICHTCNPGEFGLNNGPVPAGFRVQKVRYVSRSGKVYNVNVWKECPDCGGFGIMSDEGKPPV